MGSFVYIPAPGGGGTPITITGSITFPTGLTYPYTNMNIAGKTLTPTISLTATGATSGPTYQWYRNDVAISGATNSTYNLDVADMGCNVFLRVSYANAGGSAFFDSPSRTIFTTIFDKYPTGAAHGWWIYLLRKDHTGPLIRVRKGTGVGATFQDIYYNENGYLDIAAITAFGGTSNVFVQTVYDQMGGQHFVRDTESLQFRIYVGSTQQIESLGFRAAFTTPAGSANNMIVANVGGSGGTGAFNFLHDGSTNYTIYTVEAAQSIGASNQIIYTSFGTARGMNIGWNNTNRIVHQVWDGSATPAYVVNNQGSLNVTVTNQQSFIIVTARLTNALGPRRSTIFSNLMANASNSAVASASTGNPTQLDLIWGNSATAPTQQRHGVIIYKTDLFKTEIEALIRTQIPNLTTLY